MGVTQSRLTKRWGGGSDQTLFFLSSNKHNQGQISMSTSQTELISRASQKLQENINSGVQNENKESEIRILISALSNQVILENHLELINGLSAYPEAIEIARSLNDSKLVRQLQIQSRCVNTKISLEELIFQKEGVFYKNQNIGRTLLLYKHPFPGELQAKLAYESIIDRYLEYLQKKLKIAVLDESDYHIKIFIPTKEDSKLLEEYWEKFITEVAFSIKDNFQQTLSNLQQTFILTLKSITLADRGFSTLEIPIITQEQAIILASFYLAIIEQVRERQNYRQLQINSLDQEIQNADLSDKERNSKEKDLQKKQEMQEKEAKKYQEFFQKSLIKIFQEQKLYWGEIKEIEDQINQTGLKKTHFKKLKQQQEKLQSKIIFSLDSIAIKEKLFADSQGNPFEFIRLNIKQDSEKFKKIVEIARLFNKSATEQINSTRGDIFTQCIIEMYRLLEIPQLDEIPKPLLTVHPKLYETRFAGDDGKDFCYSCGTALERNNAKWRVARFMFESPSQRRQSSSTEDRPFICSCCSVLSFASPLKVTDDSIILKLESKINNFNNDSKIKQLKLKDYLRGLVIGEVDIISGKYIILNSQSERSSKGEVASKKLGLEQYALAKISSKFPFEVLSDWVFNLYVQSSQPVLLKNRQLILVKGLMEGYSQSIITKGNKGQEINLKLGDAIRYVQQDLPYLANYVLVKSSSLSNLLLLEQVREKYYQAIQEDLELKGDDMKIDPLWKRYKLYEDVAALTGLTYAFAQSLESTAKKLMKPEDAEREVSKLIEQIDDPVAFAYYATLGDEKKTSVQARLYNNAENYFIYSQTKKLIEEKLGIVNREGKDESGKQWLQLYADDLIKAYSYFANPELENNYAQEKDWKNLAYNLKLSLYTRFPELVRKLSSTSKGDK
ncbi:MAG: hypothetical protein VKJ02_17245 [Snowella sp.]|nr:hypothetical protein [Snowella sp.]